IAGVGDARTFGEPDVVDQDVDAAESIDGPADERLDAGRRRNVDGDRQDLCRIACQHAEIGRRSVESLRPARADGDGAVFGRKGPGTGEAEALAGAGDDRDLVGELQVHVARRPGEPVYRPPRPVRSLRVQSNGLYAT